MTNFLFLVVGLAVGWWFALGNFPKPKKQVSKGARLRTKNINNKKRHSRENKKKQILVLLKKHGKVKNDDIEKLLEVSDATVTRYMNELEKDGKVIQKGDRKVAYYELS